MEEINDGIVYDPDPDRRQARVSAALRASHFPPYAVPTGSGYVELPVIEVDPSVLIYRAQNGRILAELAEIAAERSSSVAALMEREAASETQTLLHDLLLGKAQDPDGPIFEELAKHGRQTDPLLISNKGVVVNGNRRLAAMRALFSSDPNRYEKFGSIKAAVLDTGMSVEALEFIEAALQMAPELKLAYGWINRRLKLREHARDLNREKIVEAYRMLDDRQIDRELAELSLAEAYLTWLRRPNRYHEVADLELAFRELMRQLDAIEIVHVREVWKFIGFSMIHARHDVEANVLHYFPFIDPVPRAVKSWVLGALAEDHGLMARRDAGQAKGIDPRIAGRLLPWLGDPRNANAITGAVIALVDTLKSEQQVQLGATQIHNNLRSVRRIIEKMPGGSLTEEQIREIRAELISLQAYLDAREARGETDKSRTQSGPRRLLSAILRAFR